MECRVALSDRSSAAEGLAAEIPVEGALRGAFVGAGPCLVQRGKDVSRCVSAVPDGRGDGKKSLKKRAAHFVPHRDRRIALSPCVSASYARGKRAKGCPRTGRAAPTRRGDAPDEGQRFLNGIDRKDDHPWIVPQVSISIAWAGDCLPVNAGVCPPAATG